MPDRGVRVLNQVEILDRGVVPYLEALEYQRSLARDLIEGRLDHDVLVLLEHPPVVTLGRGAHAENVLHHEGIDVVEVERGGDVTYHGPGQLVGYPIFDLKRYTQDLHWYLRTLEQALIEGLAILGIPAERNAGYTGVWTKGRKIASIGVHVKQWVTWHGFALNVTTDLGAFDRIVPCGIPGVEMTSVKNELGAAPGNVRAAVLQGFERAFDLEAITTSSNTVEQMRRAKPYVSA